MIETISPVFGALSDPTRARIFEELLEGEKNVTELTRLTRLSQPRVSRHLRILREARLVVPQRNGKWISYKVGGSGIALLGSTLERLKGSEAAAEFLGEKSRVIKGADRKAEGRGGFIKRKGKRRTPEKPKLRSGASPRKEIEDFLL